MGTGPARGSAAAGTAVRHRPLNRVRAAAAIATAALLAIAAGQARADRPLEPLSHFPAAELDIAAHGQNHHFHVRLATTDAHREQGLMFVKKLGADEGMLFLWPGASVQSFWMKNTLIPLDLLFIAADGVIIRIAADAVPLSETPIGSMGPVKAVLEVRGGTARQLGIETGDRVLFPAFTGL